MITIRLWIAFAVLICAGQISVGSVSAQSQNWASAGALGDVFVGTQDVAGRPVIKVFGHGGCANPPPGRCEKELITVGDTPASIRAFAFTTERTGTLSQYNLYVATDAGTIWKIVGQLTNGARSAPTEFLSLLGSDIRTLAFDEDRILYVGYGGVNPRIEKYSQASTVVHPVLCDVSPAPGLWFDLTARTITGKQFAVYACGGTQIRSLDVSSTPKASEPYATLPNLPGNTETARDLVLLAPIGSIGDPFMNSVREAQGGLVIAYGTNLQWIDRFGAVLRSFDFNDGPTSMNTWSSVAVSPTGGSVWGAETNTSSLTRFSFSPQPVVRFPTASVPVTALIVNGEPNLAAALQLITVNGSAATYLKDTIWEHSIKFEVLLPDGSLNPAYSSKRMAVTSFEGQTAPQPGESYALYTDLKLDGRLLTEFSEASSFRTSRGRGNYYRTVPQSSSGVPDTVDVRVTISYIHEPFEPLGPSFTGIYDDMNHSARGFLTDGGQVNQFDTNIRDEWFKTDSTARGSTRTSNDYMIGVQTGSPVSLGSLKPSTSVTLGASLPLRPSFSFPVTNAFCEALVLTVARDDAPIIVGSSLTTLNHNGAGIPYFAMSGSNSCAANLDVRPNSSEVPSNGDFAAGRTYNACVVFKDLADTDAETLPANTDPPADKCFKLLVTKGTKK